jgi:MFS transporter, PAT family, beta-lactamase induction signal transducer AmpG
MRSWFAAVRVYGDRRMLAILCMGFSSGLPLALTGATLSIWLKEAGVSLTDIGYFALVGLSYNLKFLWAPALDRAPLPLLGPWLGRRRSWALVIQAALALAILRLGMTDPLQERWTVALFAVIVAFLSASQDVVIDAYRVELLDAAEQGAGAATTQIGYQIGMLTSGAGALFLATAYGWFAAYLIMAACIAVGFVTVLMTREPRVVVPRTGHWFRSAVIEPFADFMTRRAWLMILIFVVLYKVGDAFAGRMSNPFYLTLGFSKNEIASIVKVFGVAASLGGVFLGGILVARYGTMRGLLVGGVVQMLSILMYIVQLWAGHDLFVLAFTIGTENITMGMGSAALVAYLSRLCNPASTATQYALLSALATTPRTLVAATGGWMADQLGWAPFFLFATAACLPGLALLLWLMQQRTDVPPAAATLTVR